MIFIIKGFQTIVFIFIVISTTFWPIHHPAFFRCLSNLGTFTELWTMLFIESTGVTCSDCISHNRVQVLSIPVLLFACSQEGDNHLEVAGSILTAGDTCGFNKGRNSKFREGSRVRQTPEEGLKTYWLRRWRNNNKDEDNSPKTLNDKKKSFKKTIAENFG